MTYKDVLYVVATYEARSISAAAKNLYISQSALSQAIRKLEDELGESLFIRRGTRLEPTKTCDFFVGRGREVLRVWSRFDADLKRFLEDQQTALNVGMSVGFFTNLLPYVVPRYEQAHPEVKLSIIEEDPDTLEKMVMENTLDLCVVRAPIHIPSVATLPLFTTELLLAVPRDHPFCKAHPYRGLDNLETVDLSQLKEEPFALLKHQRTDYLWRPLFAANGFEPIIYRRSSIWSNVKFCVKCGQALSIIDETAVRNEPDEDSVCYYRISKGNVHRQTLLAYHPDKYFTPQEQWFIDILKNYPTLN